MIHVSQLQFYTSPFMETNSLQQRAIGVDGNALSKSENTTVEGNESDGKSPRGLRFWLVFFSLFVAVFLACLEAVSLNTPFQCPIQTPNFTVDCCFNSSTNNCKGLGTISVCLDRILLCTGKRSCSTSLWWICSGQIMFSIPCRSTLNLDLPKVFGRKPVILASLVLL